MADRVREVMTQNPTTVEASASLKDAAELMDREDIGNVLVVENGQVQGIVTDRDIVVRAIAKDKDPADTSVREVASTDLEQLSPDDSIQDAVRKMEQADVRRLPVVEDGKPVGIVSLGDLAVEKDTDSALADISAASPNN
ncbi:MAG: CBS domain-containing protein [Thermoleophilaceae bacterium]|jgi:CBS domain-containing protein